MDVALVALAVALAYRDSDRAANSAMNVMARLLATAATADAVSEEAHGRRAGATQRRRQAVEEALAGAEAAPTLRRIQEALIDRCPSCEVALDDRDACNHVTCKSCKISFCGVCRKIGADCYVSCCRGDIYDRSSAIRARSKRQEDLVRLELSSVGHRVSQSVIDETANTLRGLKMREATEVSTSAPLRVSAEFMLGRIRRMQSEMTSLSSYFESGRGKLTKLNNPYERIVVSRTRKGHSDFEIKCAPYMGETSAECKGREDALKRGTATAFFAKMSSSRSKVHLIQRDPDTGRLSAPSCLQSGAKLEFYMSFGREKRAMNTLTDLATLRGAALSPALQALLGGRENVIAVAPEAIVASEAEKQLALSCGNEEKFNAAQKHAIDARSARLVLPVFGYVIFCLC